MEEIIERRTIKGNSRKTIDVFSNSFAFDVLIVSVLAMIYVRLGKYVRSTPESKVNISPV